MLYKCTRRFRRNLGEYPVRVWNFLRGASERVFIWTAAEIGASMLGITVGSVFPG
jgi:hypothetical protein